MRVRASTTVICRRMVAIEVRFAAVSTDTMRSLGINFQKLGSGMQFATGVPGSITGRMNSSSAARLALAVTELITPADREMEAAQSRPGVPLCSIPLPRSV